MEEWKEVCVGASQTRHLITSFMMQSAKDVGNHLSTRHVMHAGTC